MFAQVVDAHRHQLHRIQRRPAQMRGRGSMGRPASKGEIHPRVGQRQRIIHPRHAAGVPCHRRIHIIERPVAHHEGLGRPTLFCRAAIIAHAARRAGFLQPVLDGTSRQQRGRAQQVVPAAMPVAARLDLLAIVDPCLLAQARQGIVFAQNRDDRPACPRLAHHGRRNAHDILGHPKALGLQHRGMFGAGLEFAIQQLGHTPDPVGQPDQIFLVGLDKRGNFGRVLHDVLRSAADWAASRQE